MIASTQLTNIGVFAFMAILVFNLLSKPDKTVKHTQTIRWQQPTNSLATAKQFVGNSQTIRWQQPTNCLRVFHHFVGMTLKGLRY